MKIDMENILIDIMENKNKYEIYLKTLLEINKKFINFEYDNLNDFLDKVIY